MDGRRDRNGWTGPLAHWSRGRKWLASTVVPIGAPVVHTAVPLSRIDVTVQQATIAIEDRRF